MLNIFTSSLRAVSRKPEAHQKVSQFHTNILFQEIYPMSSSFYKILLTDDFKYRLRLPPQFVKDNAEILAWKTKLRIESGESWNVRIKRIGEHHFFTDGWEKFSRDLGLEFKQFLLFWFEGESGFSVSVYGITGCEQELCVCESDGSEQNRNGISNVGAFVVKSESESEEDVKIVEKHGVRAGKKWRFQTKLKEHHETELDVPRNFAETTGIAENGRIFLLTNPRSKQWPVFVTARRHDQSFAMTVGWNDFLVGRKVSIGSTISFQFVAHGGSSILIEAKVVKNGRKGLYSPKKRRGRPPNFSKF